MRAASALGAAALVFLAACGSQAASIEGAEDIADAVSEAGESGAEGVVDLREIVDGEWKRFFAFPPYALPDAVDAALGFRWEGARGPDGGARVTDDRYSLLVFTKGKQVVRDIVLNRCAAEFGAIPDVTSGIPRRQARFVIDYRTNDNTCSVLQRAPVHP